MFGITGRFVFQTIVSAIITMILIYAIKKVSYKYQIPVMTEISDGI